MQKCYDSHSRRHRDVKGSLSRVREKYYSMSSYISGTVENKRKYLQQRFEIKRRDVASTIKKKKQTNLWYCRTVSRKFLECLVRGKVLTVGGKSR